MHMRRAIAMIELIFAIVIIGIALLAVPQLLATTSKSTQVGIQQEAINEASSYVNMILTYPWDENDSNESYQPVLHVTNGDSELDEQGNSGRRVGVPPGASRVFRLYNGGDKNASSSLGLEMGESSPNDLDDFNGQTQTLVYDNSGSGGVDYLEKTTVQMATSIQYVSDSANYAKQSFNYTIPTSALGTGSSNIKEITVTLTSSSSVPELQKNDRFACVWVQCRKL